MIVTGLAALAVLATQAAALSQNCPKADFCVYASSDGSGTATFTVHSGAAGWAAIGTGSKMASSSVVVGWLNPAGGVTISSRLSTAYAMPAVAPSTLATPAALQVPAPAWAKIAFSFTRPVTAAGFAALTSPGTYIVASAAKPPSGDLSSPAATFGIHDSFSVVSGFDYNSPATTDKNVTKSGSASANEPILKLSDPEMYKLIVKIHGIMMVIAWGVAPFVGIYIARYLKAALGVWWYRLHLICMLVFCMLFTLVGTLLLFLYKTPPHFSGDYHRLFGLLVTVAVLIQVVLGFVSNAMFSPDREAVPWWDKLHWWFGRLLFIAALGCVFFGIQLYQNLGYPLDAWVPIAFGCYLFVAFIVLAFGERFHGQVHHVKGAIGGKPHEDDDKLSRAASQRSKASAKSNNNNNNSSSKGGKSVDTERGNNRNGNGNNYNGSNYGGSNAGGRYGAGSNVNGSNAGGRPGDYSFDRSVNNNYNDYRNDQRDDRSLDRRDDRGYDMRYNNRGGDRRQNDRYDDDRRYR
ncbi:hypothetical protein BC831DRAFT_475424 [Entophlyctis helioformis]|nr:hypothetical protein BC831DRAFT_475424 [Entophlyctis helioformis]